MELKYWEWTWWGVNRGLLIVLNGIEMINTEINKAVTESFNRTKWNWNTVSPTMRWYNPSLLLIVLNGIEILGFLSADSLPLRLLIVLNGIEMKKTWQANNANHPFNRTKWNWNMANIESSFCGGRILLIVLNGIEMKI